MNLVFALCAAVFPDPAVILRRVFREPPHRKQCGMVFECCFDRRVMNNASGF